MHPAIRPDAVVRRHDNEVGASQVSLLDNPIGRGAAKRDSRFNFEAVLCQLLAVDRQVVLRFGNDALLAPRITTGTLKLSSASEYQAGASAGRHRLGIGSGGCRAR